MRIAEIAPCWYSLPPDKYGGIELVVSLLADGLVARGHDVTLFAVGTSTTQAQLCSFHDTAPSEGAIDNPLIELPHVLSAYSRASEYDIVHDHTTFGIGPALGSLVSGAHVVHTLHTLASASFLRQTYEMLDARVHIVALSEAQRRNCPTVRFAATIHNGIPIESFPFSAVKDDYLLYVGRMTRTKGPHLAVQAARMAGRPLMLAAKMHERSERRFFESEVQALLTPEIQFLGEISFARKVELYARAACTLMPVEWAEPFGLVAIESLACGTPVVALRNGAVEETIESGVTGILADTMDEFVAGIELARHLDPHACRASVENRFSVDTMIDGYERLFGKIAVPRV
ncbi:MAG: glycosyltransferase family 4 protein [Acidimicrobiales bacterium]